ncbi:hypothetical protein ACFLIM_39240 [Nonomuraea sp. M3C6]|uniref:Uncharacterized protein n=1 Tax=Nonomuraea marmarensis TaxID=3351344 RepID=A0ABW7AQ79_9ACTN
MTSTLLMANPEPDWVARIIAALGIAIAGISAYVASRSMRVARAAYERSGYEITCSTEIFVDDLPPIGDDVMVRRTALRATVRNRRMGKVQLTRLHGEIEGHPPYEIGIIGPKLGFTFDGIQKEEWSIAHHEKCTIGTPLSPPVRIRVGAELANAETIWSEWVEVESSVADKVLPARRD